MGHPDFRANGRIFATLHSDDRFGMVKLSPEEPREVLRTHPSSFVPSSGAWGRQGCTNVRLDEANASAVRAAMMLAWQHAASRPRARKASANSRSKGRRRM
jgi:hypothetical protein